MFIFTIIHIIDTIKILFLNKIMIEIMFEMQRLTVNNFCFFLNNSKYKKKHKSKQVNANNKHTKNCVIKINHLSIKK